MLGNFSTRKSECDRDGERVDLLFGNEEHHFVAVAAQHFRDRDAGKQMPASSSACDNSVHSDSGCDARLHDHAFFVQARVQNCLPINVEQQSDPKQEDAARFDPP